MGNSTGDPRPADCEGHSLPEVMVARGRLGGGEVMFALRGATNLGAHLR